MKAVVMGLMLLASSLVRARGGLLESAGEGRRSGSALPLPEDRRASATASLSPLDPMGLDARPAGSPFVTPAPAAAQQEEAQGQQTEDEIVVATDGADPVPEPGDWQPACVLKNGSPMVFDRGSLRELGGATLVRWAAPADPRTDGQIYTALVDCRGKTIEAAWPGKQSDTRAGTCGRRLVDAVCELAPRPGRALSPRSDGHKHGAR